VRARAILSAILWTWSRRKQWMSRDVVYPDRSPAIGHKFELEAEELQAMKARGARKDLEDNVEILRPQFLGELSQIHGRT
jgi:hypothetical protein